MDVSTSVCMSFVECVQMQIMNGDTVVNSVGPKPS